MVCQLVVERNGPKAQAAEVLGVDIGMVSIVSTSHGRRYGQISPELRRRVERANAKRRRKQQLNACFETQEPGNCQFYRMTRPKPLPATRSVGRSTRGWMSCLVEQKWHWNG